MPYVQAALALNALPPVPEQALTASLQSDGWPARLRHTHTPSGRRLPDKEWNEYRLECAMREQLHLPNVSLAEFRDMRNWTDTIEETDDDDHEKNDDIPSYGCHP